jgi:hypothetical protein
MGFKAACLLVSTRPPGYFGTLPNHIPSRVPRLCGMLGITKAKSIEKSDLGEAIYPPKDHFVLGAFDGGFFFGSQDLFQESPQNFYERTKGKILVDFPSSQALAFQVYSTSTFFDYALYERATLVRHYAGNGNDITAEFGELQPEEKSHFARSRLKNGKRFFENPLVPFWQFPATSYGETLAFAMAARFLGAPLDQCLDLPLELELFERTK